MSEPRKTKDLAQRIDPTYFRHGHPLRRARLLLSAGLCAAGVLWVAASFALSDEAIYARGGVSEAHALLAERCDRCHVEAFGAVRDPSCLACHRAGPHVPEGKTPRDPACASCHAEHGGRARLAEVGDAHCNLCHEGHRDVTSFADHMQFARTPRDQHLRFSHRGHLVADLVGGPVACADCHKPQPGGRDFLPIRFDEHCARCHRERLDPDVGAEVPHGVEPARLAEWAAATFVKRFLEDPALVGAGRPSAVPGRAPPTPPDWTAALRARTDAALAALLTPGRGCLLCHEGDAQRIVKPEIPWSWLPKARFDHKTHRVERCETCHHADNNTEASFVDVPGVETCRHCHGPGGATATCVTCHAYHPLDAASWR